MQWTSSACRSAARSDMREDDDSEAFTDVVNFGVVSVISAGNDGDIPYVLGASRVDSGSTCACRDDRALSPAGIPLVVNSPASIAGAYTNTATLDFCSGQHYGHCDSRLRRARLPRGFDHQRESRRSLSRKSQRQHRAD